jgi:hypothetical protein
MSHALVGWTCFIVGVAIGMCIRYSKSEPHEECEEKFEHMRSRLAAQIKAREAEIDLLLKGQS